MNTQGERNRKRIIELYKDGDGLTGAQIAKRLKLSPHTVKKHLDAHALTQEKEAPPPVQESPLLLPPPAIASLKNILHHASELTQTMTGNAKYEGFVVRGNHIILYTQDGVFQTAFGPPTAQQGEQPKPEE